MVDAITLLEVGRTRPMAELGEGFCTRSTHGVSPINLKDYVNNHTFEVSLSES